MTSVSALLLVFRHFYYVGRHVSVLYRTVPSGIYCTESRDDDRRCQTEVVDRARPGQVRSSVQVSSFELTTYDLQLRKVITSPSELRFECS